MKKFFIILLIGCLPNIANTEIVYIDLNSILINSEIGKSLNTHLEKLQNEQLEKHKKIELDLIEKEKKILAQQNILEKNEFEKQIKNLSEEINVYRLNKKRSNDELNKNKIKQTKRILNILNPIIASYVDTNSISLVIPKKNIIVGKKKLDITDEIIKLLNNKSQKLDF